jgi:hypothetical protein
LLKPKNTPIILPMKNRLLPAVCLIPAAVLVLSLSSCGNDDGNDTSDTLPVADTGTAAVDTVPKELPAGVPSPTEMFAFMKMAGNSNSSFDLLNPTENEKKYESKKAQSLNLGIYSADLLYCSTFGGSNKVSAYFITCAKMGDKLKVATNLNEKDKDRISKNAGNADSLISISNDLYLSSFDNLNNNERGADLSLMLAGGWVESVYLMSTMVKDFDKDKATAERIGDQKSSLNNLIDFMNQYQSDENVKSVIAQLNELKTVYDGIQTGSGSGMSMKNGKRVLGGGSKTAITKDQFDTISKKITEIRNSFIAAN